LRLIVRSRRANLMRPLDHGVRNNDLNVAGRGRAASEDDAIVACYAYYKPFFVRAANRMAHELGIDEADLDGEGAFDLAFTEICAGGDHGLDRIRDGRDLPKLLTVILRRLFIGALRRSQAIKRGGPRVCGTSGYRGGRNNAIGADANTNSGRHRVDADLDRLASPEPPVEDVVAARLEFEALLEALPDDLHRTILTMHQHHSIEEIAHDLGRARDTIERKLKTIQMIHGKSQPGS
jgi:DNA-directed RNA polymerase specialized sigma24 family protein